MQKIYLDCPFDDKEECKSLGGKWDAENKSWFITSNLDVNKFEKWIVPGSISTAADQEYTGKTYLNCPFDDKDECKSLGGHWDSNLRMWFVPEGTDPTPFNKWFFKEPAKEDCFEEDNWNGLGFHEYQV